MASRIEFPYDFIQSSNDSAIPIRVPTIMQPSVDLCARGGSRSPAAGAGGGGAARASIRVKDDPMTERHTVYQDSAQIKIDLFPQMRARFGM
eukprot:COSAG02_NODE_42200_length_386_cov_1.898955_1_plen_91_part_01